MKPGQSNAEFRNGARVRTTAPRNDGPVPPCTTTSMAPSQLLLHVIGEIVPCTASG